MVKYYSDPVTELYQGDIREVVKELPPASCDMVMTSPTKGNKVRGKVSTSNIIKETDRK